MRLLLAIAFLAAFPVAASAGILAAEDATEVANALAEAEAEQGVCYGWNISNDFDFAADVGSSRGGPGAAPIESLCERYVILTGNIHYACGACEDSDSANIGITTNLVPAPSVADIEALGLSEGALTGDKDDVTLVNMIGALPLIAAQTGAVPALAAEVPASVPASDRPTDRPGSDFIRESWLKLVLFVFLLACGVFYWLFMRSQLATAAAREERERKRREGLARLEAEENAQPKEA